MSAIRELHLVRGAEGFGFNLTNIDGFNLFRKVEPGGVADKAGALVGDIILKVTRPGLLFVHLLVAFCFLFLFVRFDLRVRTRNRGRSHG